jgi:glycerol-3-phosphate dehydrogenase (NAD(P)+)
MSMAAQQGTPLAILGNGGFGTALAVAFAAAGLKPRLWGHDAAYTERIARNRDNPRYLPGVELPASVEVGSDPAAAVRGVRCVLCAVPTQHLRAVLSGFAPFLEPGVPLVSLSKGLEESTSRRPSEVLREVLGERPIAVLSGPSHAEELARGLPASMVLASVDPQLARDLQALLSTSTLRLYRNSDPIGVELCGALKNIIAIAAGVADGLGLGDNSKAALLTRGLAEMARFGVALGAQRETFFGLAGVGDLFTTAVSAHGRNRALGHRLGQGETLEDILAGTRKVAEGVWTSRAVLRTAETLELDMPITQQVVAVLFHGKSPSHVVRDLMNRFPKEEG